MSELKTPFFETKHWFVVLADEQTYLGYCVVILKRRDCGDLALVTEEELLDFRVMVETLQNAFRKAFGATMFNWSCLMNNAYQEAEPKPHVHWHVKPRYDRPVVFAGEVFEDPNFGHHYIRLEDLGRFLDEDIREKIVARITESLD
jgi:diadenosine tetraphosphate (Ap4A) HIT family hydrolase